MYVHFPLHPETPPEGLELSRLFAGREGMLKDMMTRLETLFREEGLPWGGAKRTKTYNSRLAQELASWAVTLPGGDAIHDALFRAYFVDGINLAETDALVRVARSIGLDGDEARAVVEERSFAEAVDEDWSRSMDLGLSGVPAYVMGGRAVVGAQPYQVLERLVKAALSV